jgi:hypothetical protein
MEDDKEEEDDDKMFPRFVEYNFFDDSAMEKAEEEVAIKHEPTNYHGQGILNA